MKKHIDIFCTTEFLVHFYNQKPDIEDETDKVELWRSFLRFIKNHVNLTLEAEKSVLKELLATRNPLFYHIANQWNQSQVRLTDSLKPLLEDKNALEEGVPCKFIFTHEADEAASEQEQILGIPFITTENFSSRWAFLHKETPLKVHKKSRARDSDALCNWRELKSLSLPGNSFLICDNFILSNYLGVSNNLFKILEALLPTSRHKEPVDITIITSQFYSKRDQHREEDINRIHQRIKKFILNGLGLINFNLTIIKKELSEYHDRHIFTNSCVYNAGNSFNFFNRDDEVRLHSITDLKIIPLTVEKLDKAQQIATNAEYYQDHLCEIHQIIEKVNGSSRCQGNKRNRLLNGFRMAGQ